jgi:hypothetical protein
MIAQRDPSDQLRPSLRMLVHPSLSRMTLLHDYTNDVAYTVGGLSIVATMGVGGAVGRCCGPRRLSKNQVLKQWNNPLAVTMCLTAV